MLRDVLREEAQAAAALDVIARVDADVILLGDVDWDAGGAGLAGITEALAKRRADYGYSVSLAPNSGRVSGFDLDGNGRLGEARDALGYGLFTGDSGLALLSRHPIDAVLDLSATEWAAGDLVPDGAVLPVPTVAQWVVSVAGMQFVTLAAGPPVFDGPEDRNGHRNAAELALAMELAEAQVTPVLLGRANQDPMDGEGQRDALADLLDHPKWIDPRPRGQGGGGDGHRGDPALDTAAWEGPGPMRVDYVLPSETLTVLDAGVVWPPPDDLFLITVEAAGSGRAVWVDVEAVDGSMGQE